MINTMESGERKGHFALCHEDALYTLKGSSLKVYLYLMRLYKGDVPSSTIIAKKMKMSKASVYKAFRELKMQGFMWFCESEDGKLIPTVNYLGQLQSSAQYEFFESPSLNPHYTTMCDVKKTKPVQKLNRFRNETGSVSEQETGSVSEQETGSENEQALIRNDRNNRSKQHHQRETDDESPVCSENIHFSPSPEKSFSDENLSLFAQMLSCDDEQATPDDIRDIVTRYHPSLSEISKAIVAATQNSKLITRIGFLKSQGAWNKNGNGYVFNSASCRASPSKPKNQFESNLEVMEQYAKRKQQEGTWT